MYVWKIVPAVLVCGSTKLGSVTLAVSPKFKFPFHVCNCMIEPCTPYLISNEVTGVLPLLRTTISGLVQMGLRRLYSFMLEGWSISSIEASMLLLGAPY